ncbi:MAG: amidohydrolase family protein, partial [Myxococcota bacterium]
MTAVGENVGTIANAQVGGAGRELLPTDGPVDILLADGVIADIAPAGALRPRGDVLDADGAWLIPGLWDHHVHVVQWALVAQREQLGHAGSAAHAARIMGAAPTQADGRRVGTGFRDALWADLPSLDVLDAATGDTPTYLINADVHSVWLNTAALRREGHEPDGVGLLREGPA